MKQFTQGLLASIFLALAIVPQHSMAHDQAGVELDTTPTHIIEVPATTREQRSKIADLGFVIEEMRANKVFVLGKETDALTLQKAGFNAKAFELPEAQIDIQKVYAQRYHSFAEVLATLKDLEKRFPQLASLQTFGSTIENRPMTAIRISGKNPGDAESNKLPVVLYTGCHHAREHLSVEMPLMFAQYLLEQYGKHPDVTRLVDSREIYIAPVINPDGHTHDYRDGTGKGRMWRKNRRDNGDGTYGVDLNRNYGFYWGSGGSSDNTSSEVYMGTEAFSEPETKAVRDFVNSQPRMTTLLTFHSFSELILYPWGHTFDKIGENGLGKSSDLPVFEKMARDMAVWNHYTPEQASDLYIASGDTTDWAYGEHGIFAFTFELTPKNFMGGGFYPRPDVIDPTFEANLKPMLYMLEFANDPHRVLTEKIPNFLQTPARSGVPVASFHDLSI